MGWLGSTSGVTDDGRLIALARFESDEAARQNSDRPEQTAWWEQTATLFTDEPVFHNSTSVEVDTPGDPSQAGFVQVMQGRSSDPDRRSALGGYPISLDQPGRRAGQAAGQGRDRVEVEPLYRTLAATHRTGAGA